MKSFTLTLTNNQKETYDLVYGIRQTEAAQIWAQCVSNAIPFGFSEVDRFDGFPGNPRDNKGFLINKLNGLIAVLQKQIPDISFPTVDANNLQQSLNHLHKNFAHSHLVEMRITPESEVAWRDLNTLIHVLEGVESRENAHKALGIRPARITFTWKHTHRVPMPDPVYEDFTLSYDFGTAYINYPQVGRQIHEMFYTQDDVLEDQHIQPTRYISADTTAWFGPTDGHDHEHRMKEEIRQWFLARKDRFEKLGFQWGDPKLSLGQVPVAKLKESLYTQKEINSFVEYLGNFNQVAAVRIE